MMDLYKVIDQVAALLQQRGRLTYRALKVQFQLEDEQLEAVKEELIEGLHVATDEGGKVLVWIGSPASSVPSLASAKQSLLGVDQTLDAKLNDPRLRPPVAYTPAHLADRIRAVTVTDGERKTITALFADLKGSTALIEDLDPEEA
jgi:hypothetical protein